MMASMLPVWRRGGGGRRVWHALMDRSAHASFRLRASRHHRWADPDHAAASGCWAIDGTPADCVRVGLAKLTPDVAWVLSGMNHGGNLGADVYHSGTVAAVREAALHGRPGIAISQYRKRNVEIDWERARRWMGMVLECGERSRRRRGHSGT